MQRVDLEVRDGAVRADVSSEDGARLGAERLADYLTIDALFALIQDAMDGDAAAIDVSSASSGYPVEAQIDYAERLADDERGFAIHALGLR